MTQQNTTPERAVSEVVGEMIMIGIVLILVAVFTASLADYLPSERTPSVTIQISNDTVGNITLWHKGGDWVEGYTLKVIITNSTKNPVTYTWNDDAHRFLLVPDTSAFDLESNITVSTGRALEGNESVVLTTDRAVLSSVKIGRGGS